MTPPIYDDPMVLLAFNIGVEIRQLMIVAAGLTVLAVFRRYSPVLIQPAKTVAAYDIGIITTYWFIERIVFYFVLWR